MKQLTIPAQIDMLPPVPVTPSTLVDQFQALAQRLGTARLQLRSARLAADAEFERTVMTPASTPAGVACPVYDFQPEFAVPGEDDDEIESQAV